MSHVVAGRTVITDLGCLEKALAKFPKLKMHHGKKTYRWFGTWVDDYSRDDAAYKNGVAPEDYGKCDHMIKMDGVEYEIGVVNRKDGKGFSLIWDFFSCGRHISDYIGKGAEHLMTEYNKLYCEQYAMNEGMMTQTREDDNYVYVDMFQ